MVGYLLDGIFFGLHFELTASLMEVLKKVVYCVLITKIIVLRSGFRVVMKKRGG
ncbi:hypothetical protein HanRHA438_Chr03g0119371 [Helianthus annuus]|nr:hypothetical protein HanRHA438_Chr03g0119371 [Helianthus annuus]